ncbi:MAG TPA: hypothetical protein VE174_00500 [Actinomycetota bacterium]|nr:hypothetical protein [Actinomycetota bacterium]
MDDRAERERRNALLVTGAIVLVVVAFAVRGWWPGGEPTARRDASRTAEPTPEPAADIYVYDLTNEQDVRLTDHSGPDVDPAWSPDGSRIAFARFTDENLHDIYVMDADGGDQVRVVGGPTDAFAPSWSPDGEEIVFMSGSTFADIFVVDVATGAVRVTRIGDFPTGDEWPAWSPVADRIAYVEERPESDETRIFTVRSDGTDRRIVQVLEGCCEVRHLEWSPDGRFLAFTWEQAGSVDVWIVYATGGGPVRKLTYGDLADGFASWSPDGRRLVFQTNRNALNEDDLYVIRSDGTGERALLRTPWYDANPDWSPDGRYIAFDSIEGADGRP